MDQTTANHIPILRKRRAIIATLAAAVLLGGCGSDGDSSASAPTTSASKPAAAKENATTAPVCYDLYVAGKTTPCAENTIGPGGGVIFYDAKTVQPWGRFLEVAPWIWNPGIPADKRWDCPGGCGADANSLLRPIQNRTQDGNSPFLSTEDLWGYALCLHKGTLGTAAGNTGEAIGTGRANTAALLADPACSAISDSNTLVMELVAEYRGGGLADWFLPSRDELVALCRFGNRNGVGGFIAGGRYASSSTETGDWTVWEVGFDNCGAETDSAWTADVTTGKDKYATYWVRPIRAF